ncbi:abortive infection family protein [Roseateles sp.]|uniref:abortive infection family protein n=1 Tax=Roseateles sp. TaxID=1971397 RepID=UPI002E0B0BF7|nr:abortive infection family protein [Roseateles sp.]
MIQLYFGSGSTEIELLDDRFAPDDWQRLTAKAVQLLRLKGDELAAQFLESRDFELRRGTNGFCDEFCLLYQRLPMDDYVRDLDLTQDIQAKESASVIARAVQEVTGEHVRFVALELDSSDAPQPVAPPILEATSDTVERALNDAARLMSTEGSTSAVDRVHTALHAYLRVLASRAGLPYGDNDGITDLYKLLRTQHPAFAATGPNQAAVDKVMRGLASMIDALNPLRNHSSIAHANEELLAEPEATLVINSVRSLLHYFNAKTRI